MRTTIVILLFLPSLLLCGCCGGAEKNVLVSYDVDPAWKVVKHLQADYEVAYVKDNNVCVSDVNCSHLKIVGYSSYWNCLLDWSSDGETLFLQRERGCIDGILVERCKDTLAPFPVPSEDVESCMLESLLHPSVAIERLFPMPGAKCLWYLLNFRSGESLVREVRKINLTELRDPAIGGSPILPRDNSNGKVFRVDVNFAQQIMVVWREKMLEVYDLEGRLIRILGEYNGAADFMTTADGENILYTSSVFMENTKQWVHMITRRDLETGQEARLFWGEHPVPAPQGANFGYAREGAIWIAMLMAGRLVNFGYGPVLRMNVSEAGQEWINTVENISWSSDGRLLIVNLTAERETDRGSRPEQKLALNRVEKTAILDLKRREILIIDGELKHPAFRPRMTE